MNTEPRMDIPALQDREPRILEHTNEHGFTDYVFEDQPNMPICSTCRCYVMPNRGQGSTCDRCHHEIELEMSHDYDEGRLR